MENKGNFIIPIGKGVIYPCNFDGSLFGNFKPELVDSSNLMDSVVRLFAIQPKYGFKFFKVVNYNHRFRIYSL